MNRRMLVVGAGIVSLLLLVTLGMFFFFKSTFTIEPMKVYEVPAPVGMAPELSEVVVESAVAGVNCCVQFRCDPLRRI